MLENGIMHETPNSLRFLSCVLSVAGCLFVLHVADVEAGRIKRQTHADRTHSNASSIKRTLRKRWAETKKTNPNGFQAGKGQQSFFKENSRLLRRRRFKTNPRNVENIAILVEDMRLKISGNRDRVYLLRHPFKQKHVVEIYLSKKGDFYADVKLEGQIEGWETVATMPFDEFLKNMDLEKRLEGFDYVKKLERALVNEVRRTLWN